MHKVWTPANAVLFGPINCMRAFSLQLFVETLPMLAGAPLAGVILDNSGGRSTLPPFLGVWLLCGGSLFMASVVSLVLLPRPHGISSWKQPKQDKDESANSNDSDSSSTSANNGGDSGCSSGSAKVASLPSTASSPGAFARVAPPSSSAKSPANKELAAAQPHTPEELGSELVTQTNTLGLGLERQEMVVRAATYGAVSAVLDKIEGQVQRHQKGALRIQGQGQQTPSTEGTMGAWQESRF
jgi:hypothetical protein